MDWLSFHGSCRSHPLRIIRGGSIFLVTEFYKKGCVSKPHAQFEQIKKTHNKSGLSADIYIAGHRHTWGMMTTELQGRVVHVCRAKGFKGHGEYEEVKGFEA